MKLIIVGEGGVGKSTYRELLEGKDFKKRHVPTLGAETQEISYNGTRFTIWDTSGTERFAGLKEGYYIGADCAMIMISDTILSYESIEKFKNTIISKCGNIPILIVVNKCDLELATVNYNNLVERGENMVLISCKENISIHEPLEKIIEMI